MLGTYHQLLQGSNLDPGDLVLSSVSTRAVESKCFLTSRMNSATAIPEVELIHSLGSYLVVLGQPGDLHGHAFAFVGEQIGDQLPSTFLEPTNGGALLAFQAADVEVPSQAKIDAHRAQDNAPPGPRQCATGGPRQTRGCLPDSFDAAPCFVGGDAPKGTLDKIELMVASVPAADRGVCEFVQQWGRTHVVWPRATLEPR